MGFMCLEQTYWIWGNLFLGFIDTAVISQVVPGKNNSSKAVLSLLNASIIQFCAADMAV